MLAWIRKEFELPVLSDVHSVEEVAAAREVLDVIQIPAFLCQQTTLLIAAGKSGKPVNIKKGQFMSPSSMKYPAGKGSRTGNERILITERGAQFGYHNLVADMTAIPEMKEIGYPVVFDAGHQIRRYGIPSTDPAGGHSRELIPVLLRSAIAAGTNGASLGFGWVSRKTPFVPFELIPVLLRSAIAAGTNGVFLETHPNPSE